MLRAVAIALLLTALAQSAQAQKKPPYWASIAAGDAMMRTGPAKKYPATWRYRRADLPVRVVETYPNWRKIQDPAGTTGWMLVNLLSDRRTGIVVGGEVRPMHEKPDPSSRVLYLAQPGVVGRISECAYGWCRFAVKRREGYIRAEHFWGTDPGETF